MLKLPTLDQDGKEERETEREEEWVVLIFSSLVLWEGSVDTCLKLTVKKKN